MLFNWPDTYAASTFPRNTCSQTHLTQHSKLHLNWFSCFCTAHGRQSLYFIPHHHQNRFTALFLGQPGSAGARSELLDFMVQRKINRGRPTNHPAGCHSIQTNQCPSPPSPILYRPDALPAAQPTVSKHCEDN